ncbi:unnamed protein product [Notodromas monacha]|uniref:Transmembrane protein 186 n=1 Tax=Notodromas monacha TaxID=399045 RepID=A0A7R9GAG0_9CRUS|nr:unnamed protein product [Notodromas monacha]CAG0915324.1 unnamed protein product [Notodromas monacha]
MLCRTLTVLACRRTIASARRFSLSRLTSTDNSVKQVEEDNFKLVFRFPYIRAAKLVCRLKLYQTGVTVIAFPATTVMQMQGLLEPHVSVTLGFVSVFALGMLGVMGEIFRKLVGILYVNEATNEVKIAHLTFFGSRNDIVVPMEDIVPMSDSSENVNDAYVKLMRYSTKDPFYVCFKYGGVEDKRSFLSLNNSSSPGEKYVSVPCSDFGAKFNVFSGHDDDDGDAMSWAVSIVGSQEWKCIPAREEVSDAGSDEEAEIIKYENKVAAFYETIVSKNKGLTPIGKKFVERPTTSVDDEEDDNDETEDDEEAEEEEEEEEEELDVEMPFEPQSAGLN